MGNSKGSMRLDRCAVLGAGAGGHAAAADLSLAGVEVNLYELPEFEKSLKPVIDRGGIEIRGKAREGFAKLSMVTTDIKKAIKDVDCLFVTTQALGHEAIARTCAPHLRDGHILVLFPGSAGSLLIAKILKDLGVKKNILIGETVTLPYQCWLAGPAEVEVIGLAEPENLFSTFPSKDTERIINGLKTFYPSLSPATNVLEVGLLNPNIVKHPMVLFSVAYVESSKKPFCLNKEGMTPAVWRVFNQVDAEKMAILKKLGLNSISDMELLTRILPISYDEWVKLNPANVSGIKSRQIAEDVPTGNVLLSSLGKMIGVDTPTIDSIIHLFSIIHETDYYKQGRTVEKLGISRMNIETLNRFLAQGA